MKKHKTFGITAITFAFLLTLFTANQSMAQYPDQSSITYQTFYDDLSPYGTWIDYPAYGHVWHPAISNGFRPYLTNGYWDYSNEGWMWMSNYDWGWAPFHYGRWVYDDLYGWLWIPGYEWSPAWVTWGSLDNYYAWAPLMPGVNVGIQYGAWRPDAFYWNVCGREHIYDRDIYNAVEGRDNVYGYANRISIINNFNTTNVHNQFYSKGPDVNEVQRYTNRTITPAVIRSGSNPMANNSGRSGANEIQVYRPPVQHPQPREFRRVDNPAVIVDERKNQPSYNPGTPAVNPGNNRNYGENQQKDNINRLPVHRAPPTAFPKSNVQGNGGRSRQGNRRSN